MEGREKYHKDKSFADPLIRCDRCSELIQIEELRILGSCPKCGNARVTNVRVMSEEEMKWARAEGIDPLFLSLFEQYEEE